MTASLDRDGSKRHFVSRIRANQWRDRALAAESKLASLEGLERAATMALQQLYHANAGAFENGVTDSTGSIDEGSVRAGEIMHDLELALGISRSHPRS